MSQWVRVTVVPGYGLPHARPRESWINLDHVSQMDREGDMTSLFGPMLVTEDTGAAQVLLDYVVETPEQLLAATSTDGKLRPAYQELLGRAEDAAMDLGELARALTASNPRVALRAQEIRRVLQTAITVARLAIKQQETMPTTEGTTST